MSAALSKPRISRAASMPFSPGIMMSSRYSVKRSWRAASSSAAALRKLFTRTGVPRSSSHAPISSVRLPSSSVWSSQTAMYISPPPFLASFCLIVAYHSFSFQHYLTFQAANPYISSHRPFRGWNFLLCCEHQRPPAGRAQKEQTAAAPPFGAPARSIWREVK